MNNKWEPVKVRSRCIKYLRFNFLRLVKYLNTYGNSYFVNNVKCNFVVSRTAASRSLTARCEDLREVIKIRKAENKKFFAESCEVSAYLLKLYNNDINESCNHIKRKDFEYVVLNYVSCALGYLGLQAILDWLVN